MDWKQKLEMFEDKRDWKSAIEHMIKVLTDHSEDPEAWVRILYLLHNVLLEEDPEVAGLNEDELEKTLIKYFQKSRIKFSENPEYLFFMGVIGHIAEYYWGEKTDDFATAMSKKAVELEPNNTLYKWGALTSDYCKSECEQKKMLAKIILDDSSKKIWLQQKGFPGRYILNIHINGSAKITCLDNGMQYGESLILYRKIKKLEEGENGNQETLSVTVD